MGIRRLVGALAIGAAATLVVSCGGAVTSSAPSSGSPGTPGVSIGGTVSGLAGTVMLQNNGSDTLSISANGSFRFSAPVANGSPFNVTVRIQPLGQICSVANGTGTASGVSVSNVGVRCLADSFTVGGTVSGLSGSVVLQNNGADNLTISVNGGFTFPSALANASQYNVTVLTQPSGQTCTVAHGVGTLSGANVTNVAVTCATNTFSVGGTVSGLTGTLVLRVNGGNNLSVSANGPFTFATPLADGSPYSVTVLTQPTGQSCSIAGGTGTITGANVTSVSVSCAPNTFTVGGTVSGLSGSVVLQNNGADNLTISVNGGFTFPSALANASQYNVTVLTQPSGQTCTVAHGVGTLSGANVTNVAVTCATNTFSVGGTVSGLTGTLVLRVNGGNNLSVSANGPFTFATPLADGSPYSVTVLTQPTGQSCSIAGGTGTITGANVTSVSVSCAPNTFTVGGTVSGLSGSVVLQNNGADNLTISVNGGFTFPSALANASQYNVTVLTQPSGQTCTVAHGVGTLSGANVTNVSVACSTNSPAVGYTTTFPATENPISEGGHWINTVSATWNAPVSTVGGSPGHAVGLNSTGFNDSIAMLTGSFTADQEVTATAYRGGASGAAEIELHLRMTMVPGSPDRVFTYEIDVVPSLSAIVIARWNGPQGNFTNLNTGFISGINDGDVIDATVIGPASAAVITVKLNGVTIVTATDTAGLATGNPGIGFDAGTQANGANFGIRSFTATSLGP